MLSHDKEFSDGFYGCVVVFGITHSDGTGYLVGCGRWDGGQLGGVHGSHLALDSF